LSLGESDHNRGEQGQLTARVARGPNVMLADSIVS